MKNENRYPEVIAMKLTREQAETIRRAAEADDRPVSHFLRRVIAEALKPQTQDADAK